MAVRAAGWDLSAEVPAHLANRKDLAGSELPRRRRRRRRHAGGDLGRSAGGLGAARQQAWQPCPVHWPAAEAAICANRSSAAGHPAGSLSARCAATVPPAAAPAPRSPAPLMRSSTPAASARADYGFDPLNLGKNPEALKWYQQAELQNGRWAMLGVAGILVQVRSSWTLLHSAWAPSCLGSCGCCSPAVLRLPLLYLQALLRVCTRCIHRQ